MIQFYYDPYKIYAYVEARNNALTLTFKFFRVLNSSLLFFIKQIITKTCLDIYI